jgi:hypothetical protein
MGIAMVTSPVEVLDGLIRGLVFAAYDFIRLTVTGIILPFVSGTRSVFLPALSTTKRLSSLTYLVIWILVTMTLAFDNAARLASGALDLEKKSDIAIPTLIAGVLLIAMVIDVSVRAGFSLIRDRAKVDVYEPLARIAVANIFFGMSVLLAFEAVRMRGQFRLFPMSILYWDGVLRPIGYTNPLLLLFAISLAVIVIKAVGLRDWKRRLYVGAPIVLLAPALLLNASIWLYGGAYLAGNWFFPEEESRLTQRFTRCSYAPGQIHVSSLIGLQGPAALLAIAPRDLAIYGGNDRYLGRGDEGQPPLVVSRADFKSVAFDAKYDPIDKADSELSSGAFECTLKVLTLPVDPSRWVEYVEDPNAPKAPESDRSPPRR